MTEVKTEKKISKKFLAAGVIVIIIAAGAYFFISSSKSNTTKEDASERSKEVAAGTRIRVAEVTPSAPERTITLPGEVRPYSSVTLYAKISGYLKAITVDKGDNVHAGQVLATIESPETERTYQAAAADAKNKSDIAKRNQVLLSKNLVAQQDAEQAEATAQTAEETVKSIGEMLKYEKIIAPFAGKITARFADPGSLVQSGANSQGGTLPVVTLSDQKRLRIYVYLDQSDATSIREGDSVTIRLIEKPDLKIPARVTRISGELSAQTRTLLAEIDVDNKNNVILPGSFVHVMLKLKARPFLQMPSDALIIKGKEFYAAVVDSSGILHFRKIEIADNDGRTIQLASGLEAGEKVAIGVGNSLKDGAKVQPIAAPTTAPQGK